MDDDLIDQIYESSFVPERWSNVLDRLAQIIDAPGGTLFILNRENHLWTSSERLRKGCEQVVRDGWLKRGNFLPRLYATQRAGFITENDAFTPEELEEEPLWRDWFRPRGFGWGAGTVIQASTGENIWLSLNRFYNRGAVEQELITKLDLLRPHIARSVTLSARLQLERARVASETLAAMGIPALALDEKNKVLAANRLIENMAKNCVSWKAFDQVSFFDKVADKLLKDAMAAINMCGTVTVQSFPVRNTNPDKILVAHVVPIRLSARDIFAHCAAIVVLMPIAAPNAPPVELVQALFDFTPAEARVARDIASGKSVDDIASAGGVSSNTVRTHVRRVLEKTGCGRQTDVVALLTGIGSPG